MVCVGQNGKRHPAWKAGKDRGYVRLPYHKREHRAVMEAILGRPLLSVEVVHHINGNKADNRPNNLRLYDSNKDHLHGEHSGPVPIELRKKFCVHGHDLSDAYITKLGFRQCKPCRRNIQKRYKLRRWTRCK